jgi:calcineurin-like phosphoesterase
MKILFLGDVVGISGCSKLMNNLMNEIKSKNIDFVIVNGENAASQGVGLTKEICNDFFNCWSRCNYNWKSCLGSKRNNGVYR